MEKLIIVTLALLLSGCSLFDVKPTQPVTIYKTLPITCNVKKPDPIVPLNVDIQMVQDTEGVWWVAVDAQSYMNLAQNNQEVLRYIRDLQAYADVLNKCIEDSNKTADKKEGA